MIAAAPTHHSDRSATAFSPAFAPAAKAVPAGALVSEGLRQDALISWFRGEFAAANAIIDAMCSHLRLIGGDETVPESEYDAVFAAIHRRRLNWIPVLHMQKYHSIAEVAIELEKVAVKKAEELKQSKAEEEEKEMKNACFNGDKLTENELNGDVDDSPTSDITDSGKYTLKHFPFHRFQTRV